MSPSRTPFIAGNWKMHKTVAEAEEYVSGLLPRVSSADGVDVALCVPFTSLQAVVDSTRGSRVDVYAQNMHQAAEGAFTGEVSGPMLDEIGVHGVVLGHSERREHFGETDRALAEKVPAAMALGLKPILCVGEGLDVRELNGQVDHCVGQVERALEGVPAEAVRSMVIAYEPVWAIGTGRVASAADAQEVCAAIRATLAELADASVAASAVRCTVIPEPGRSRKSSASAAPPSNQYSGA